MRSDLVVQFPRDRLALFFVSVDDAVDQFAIGQIERPERLSEMIDP